MIKFSHNPTDSEDWMQTKDEILAALNTLGTSLGLSDYCVLGMALVNVVKTGELSHSDMQKVGIMLAGDITGDVQVATGEAEKYGPLVDEQELKREIAQLNAAQLTSLAATVTLSQQVLPLMFKQGMKKFLGDLPPLRAGRHASLNDAQKKDACERILKLVAKKVKLGDAINRIAAALGRSPSTVSRAWAERDKLLAQSSKKPLADLGSTRDVLPQTRRPAKKPSS